MHDISYYFENWNTNMVSLAAVVCLVLMISGYFYGKVLQKYIKPLKKIDCTFIGVFFIFAVFQIFIFMAVTIGISTDTAELLIAVVILISPAVCLLTWSNPLPSLNNLFSILTGFVIVYFLGKTSAELNTNNIFFDSIHYLSAVLESSVQNQFGHLNFYSGGYVWAIDQLHDFEGFVYFWGMMLRWVRDLTKIKESLTPVYIWGASFVYWMALGSLVWNSVTVLFKKWWKVVGIAAVLLVISPYYTNYWNTTLAFFGNSLRTVIIGNAVLLAYLYVKETEGTLFLAQMICIYAALFTSSSGFFLEAFIIAGLFFYMTWTNQKNLKDYICFIICCTPLVHYAIVILTPYWRYYWRCMLFTLIPILVLLAIAVLIRKHLNTFNKVMRWLFPVMLIGLLAVSFIKRNGGFPYAFWFSQRSDKDMANNFTRVYEERDRIRNILLYLMTAGLLIRPLSIQKEFKLFLLFIITLFLTPLTVPAVANYMTSTVYSRSFDLIVNPFTLTFLLCNLLSVFEWEKQPWLKYAGIIPLLVLSYISLPLGRNNLEVPYTNNLIFKEDGFDSETKVAPDSWDLYNWIDYNIRRTNDERPVFLSQDIGLKGYVADIELAFSSSDYRDCLADDVQFEEHKKMLAILYPEKRYLEDEIKGITGDYNDLSEVLEKYEAEYLIIRNTIAVWDERGWYNKSYQPVLNNGQCQVIYENDTWALLMVNPDWVREVPEGGETEEGEDLIG